MGETMWTLLLAACGMPFDDFWGPFDRITKWTRLLLVVFVALFIGSFNNLITATFVDGVIHFSTMERDWILRDTMICSDSPLQKLKKLLLSNHRAVDGFISLKTLRKELIRNCDVQILLES